MHGKPIFALTAILLPFLTLTTVHALPVPIPGSPPPLNCIAENNCIYADHGLPPPLPTLPPAIPTVTGTGMSTVGITIVKPTVTSISMFVPHPAPPRLPGTSLNITNTPQHPNPNPNQPFTKSQPANLSKPQHKTVIIATTTSLMALFFISITLAAFSVYRRNRQDDAGRGEGDGKSEFGFESSTDCFMRRIEVGSVGSVSSRDVDVEKGADGKVVVALGIRSGGEKKQEEGEKRNGETVEDVGGGMEKRKWSFDSIRETISITDAKVKVNEHENENDNEKRKWSFEFASSPLGQNQENTVAGIVFEQSIQENDCYLSPKKGVKEGVMVSEEEVSNEHDLEKEAAKQEANNHHPLLRKKKFQYFHESNIQISEEKSTFEGKGEAPRYSFDTSMEDRISVQDPRAIEEIKSESTPPPKAKRESPRKKKSALPSSSSPSLNTYPYNANSNSSPTPSTRPARTPHSHSHSDLYSFAATELHIGSPPRAKDRGFWGSDAGRDDFPMKLSADWESRRARARWEAQDEKRKLDERKRGTAEEVEGDDLWDLFITL